MSKYPHFSTYLLSLQPSSPNSAEPKGFSKSFKWNLLKSTLNFSKSHLKLQFESLPLSPRLWSAHGTTTPRPTAATQLLLAATSATLQAAAAGSKAATAAGRSSWQQSCCWLQQQSSSSCCWPQQLATATAAAVGCSSGHSSCCCSCCCRSSPSERDGWVPGTRWSAIQRISTPGKRWGSYPLLQTWIKFQILVHLQINPDLLMIIILGVWVNFLSLSIVLSFPSFH